jgi:hypothetical protein
MFILMSIAGGCAGVAYLRTKRANFAGVFTGSSHGRRCHGTDCGAVNVGCNTTGHHGDIFFFKAPVYTLVAYYYTLITGLNAFIVVFA